MVTELLPKIVISCVVCTMQDNRFLLFLNYLRSPYSNLKSFALLLNIHMSRHSYAVMAISNGMPIESVSKVLGHTKITTTQRYAKITVEKLDKDFSLLERRIGESMQIV